MFGLQILHAIHPALARHRLEDELMGASLGVTGNLKYMLAEECKIERHMPSHGTVSGTRVSQGQPYWWNQCRSRLLMTPDLRAA